MTLSKKPGYFFQCCGELMWGEPVVEAHPETLQEIVRQSSSSDAQLWKPPVRSLPAKAPRSVKRKTVKSQESDTEESCSDEDHTEEDDTEYEGSSFSDEDEDDNGTMMQCDDDHDEKEGEFPEEGDSQAASGESDID